MDGKNRGWFDLENRDVFDFVTIGFTGALFVLIFVSMLIFVGASFTVSGHESGFSRALATDLNAVEMGCTGSTVTIVSVGNVPVSQNKLETKCLNTS